MTALYPGCGDDATPSLIFGRSQVINVDPEGHRLKPLRKLGCKTVTAAIEDCGFADQFDFVLLQNSHGACKKLAPQLTKLGGYVLAGAYCHDAHAMRDTEGMNCLGAVKENNDEVFWIPPDVALAGLGETEVSEGYAFPYGVGEYLFRKEA